MTNPRLRPVAGVFLAVTASGAASGWFRGLDSRPDAAWFGLIALLWAAGLTGGLRAAPARSLWALGAVAIAARAVHWGALPLLSDDVYRYLWEGTLLNAGGNPFLTAPAAVRGLDDALAARVNHPEITAIYPPIAQLGFRLLDAIGGG